MWNRFGSSSSSSSRSRPTRTNRRPHEFVPEESLHVYIDSRFVIIVQYLTGAFVHTQADIFDFENVFGKRTRAIIIIIIFFVFYLEALLYIYIYIPQV